MLTTCLIGLATPASTQEVSRIELSGSYSLLEDANTVDAFHGWLASLSVNVTRSVGLTLELGGNYQDQFFGRFTIVPVLVGAGLRRPESRP
jgi:hypothetical protein